ncbi:MAG: ubiquinone biosynthesis regulatory protein kinase UbiB, partial [Haliea sp.]
EVQPSLVLLQKTLLNIEGLGRQLYPQLNLWDTAQPFLERWIQERYSPQSVLKRLQRHLPSWLEQLPQVPDAVLDNLQRSQGVPATQASGLQQRQRELMAARDRRLRLRRRRLLAAVAGGLAVLVALPGGLAQLATLPWVSWLLAATALALLWPRRSDG